MTFAWPHVLWLLALPLALLARELAHRRRTGVTTHPKILRAEARANSLDLSTLNSQLSTSHGRVRPWLCAGLALSLFALARPQWGRLEEPVFDQSREILLAIDLSRSMLAPDVKPSRLDRAKLLIQSLLEKLEGERVGLVVFAGTAFLQSPLSADYEILREFLPSLNPEFLPQGGSNYGALLDASIQAFSATNAADRFLVILSDGEATDDEWRSHLPELKKKQIRVIGLGVGTPEGAMLPDGSGGLIKDERGAVVMSKLEPATLQALAQASDGVYRDASAWVDLAALVQQTIETGRKGQFVDKNTIRLVERFQWPLAFGLWCLLLSLCYEFPVRPRIRDLRVAPAGGTPPDPLKKTSTTVAALALLALALQYPVSGYAAATRATPGQPSPLTPVTPSVTPPTGAPVPPAAPANDTSAIGKIIGRIALADTPGGRDYAELASETVIWGSRLQSAQQKVPEGPVRDALAAVNLGSKLDPKTADWTKLRQDLEALLEKKDEEDKKDDQQQNQDQKNQDQDQKDQQQKKNEDQKNQDKQKQKQQKDQGDQKQDQGDQNDTSGEDPQKKDDKKQDPGESAFGDMDKKDEPPQPPKQPSEDTQKVGGEDKPQPKQQADPALALPLQKLDQLRDQDSPAQLFQLMEGEKKPTKKTTKDW